MSRYARSRRCPLLPADDTGAAQAGLAQHFRAGHGRITAALTRRFGTGQLALVENAIQEACLRALEHWPRDGLPQRPEGWLVQVAHNIMVDALRQDARLEPLDPLDGSHDIAVDPPPPEAEDDELRLVFLCCHPVLGRAAQLALVLNVAFGLRARQIAHAFLIDERTVSQRIVRAKARLREEGPRFDLPDEHELPPRLATVLDVLYLVFSEGSHPSGHGAAADDDGLCSEALRLVRLLTAKPRTAVPAAWALRALLAFHAARLPARLAEDGSLLLIQEQDRGRWDTALAEEAFRCLQRAGTGTEVSRFHLEAGIAACHAIGPTYAGTDWQAILGLYDGLRERWPSLVIDVNRALAVAMVRGARAGLDELDAIPERDILGRYPYALAAYADLLASLGELEAARQYLDEALRHQSAPAQQALLLRKRRALGP